MKKYGEKELLNEISGMDDNAKPVAVIFNLGVNDLIHKTGSPSVMILLRQTMLLI